MEDKVTIPVEFKLNDGRIMVLKEEVELIRGLFIIVCLDLERKFDHPYLNAYPAKVITVTDIEILELVKIKELVVDIIEL